MGGSRIGGMGGVYRASVRGDVEAIGGDVGREVQPVRRS